MHFPATVTLIDVSPRDGLQNEPEVLSVDQKIALVERLAAAGLAEIEVGSFVSPKAVPQMAGTDEVFRRMRRQPHIRYHALIPNMRGYELAVAAGATSVRTVVAASKPLHEANFRRTIAESLADHVGIIERARADGVALEAMIGGSFGDPFVGPTSVDDVLRCVDHYYQHGVKAIGVADTVGMGTPKQIAAVITAIQRRYPDVQLTTHFHDTRSAGFANILTALDLGVTRHDAALGGTGGCPFAPKAGGNICLEDLVNMLNGMGIETGIDLDALIDAARWLQDVLGKPLPSKMLKSGPVYPVFRPTAAAPVTA
ncbi:MAG: hydroxymethylglutaryl-CoA lyase [Dehalococcoidia bacterium]|nr:hydroxymethylglutaryl-CoA lyase [Dehalococcoidia bacterium]